MRYCPECNSSFEDTVRECPQCKVTLAETADFTEVFRASNLMEAEAIEAALKDEGVEVIIRTTSVPTIPMMGETAEIPIEVRADQVEQAKKIIEEVETATAPSDLDEQAMKQPE